MINLKQLQRQYNFSIRVVYPTVEIEENLISFKSQTARVEGNWSIALYKTNADFILAFDSRKRDRLCALCGPRFCIKK